MNNEGKKACKNCVNFIELSDTTVMCDYEYWFETHKNRASTYIPLDFDCIHFEDIDSIE